MIYILRPSIKYCTVLIWGTVPCICHAQTSVSKYHTHTHKGTLLNTQKKVVVDTNKEKLNLKPQNVGTGKTVFKLIETMFYCNMHTYTAFL